MKQPEQPKSFELQLDYPFFEWDRRPAPVDPKAPKVKRPVRTIHVFEKISVDETGLHVHYRNMKYSKHGFPFKEAIFAIDIVKKYTMSLVHTLAMRELKWAYVGFAILPWKKKIKVLEKALEKYVRFADSINNNVKFRDGLVGTIYLKRMYYQPFSIALWDLVKEFLQQLGISEDLANSTGKVIATIFENDDAYRYRIEDLLTETDKYTFRVYPRREIKRLSALLLQRDKQVSHKFMDGIKLFRFALLSRKMRSAFRMAVFSIDFRDLQLDAADRYHVLQRTGYDFLGLSEEVRGDMYREANGETVPDLVEVY